MTKTRTAKPAAAPSSLDRLLEEIRACRVCRTHPLGRPLPHEPRPVVRASLTARILIVGQAPGTRVHASGKPFDDRSGDRLRAWLNVSPDVFYDTARIAIAPMGFCFPGQDANGGDRPPRPECAPLWRARLMSELKNIDLVLLVGTYAQRWYLGDEQAPSLTETVRAGPRPLASLDRALGFPLPHPSWRNTGWLKSNPWFEALTVPLLRRAVAERL